MACYHPLTAFKMPYMVAGQLKHEISFKECSDSIKITLPCGQCVGCRLEKSRQWAMRCMHEAQMHEQNCFITLTYDDNNLPSDQSLHHEHFQRFFKLFRHYAWRKHGKKLRFYMAGEYGEKRGRPHYHACIFGIDFHDKELFKRTSSGSLIYRSKDLEALWPHGYSSIGDVNFESAAYVARYIMKKAVKSDHSSEEWKWSGKYTDLQTGEICQITPEYNKMSLKPGIGAEWYKKYRADVYPHDYVVIRGKKVRPPKYYDNQYKTDYPYEFDEILYKRETSAKLNFADNTLERLAVKEQVARAKLQKLKRTLT